MLTVTLVDGSLEPFSKMEHHSAASLIDRKSLEEFIKITTDVRDVDNAFSGKQ